MLGVTRKSSGASIGSSMDLLVSFYHHYQDNLVFLLHRFRAVIVKDFWEILCWWWSMDYLFSHFVYTIITGYNGWFMPSSTSVQCRQVSHTTTRYCFYNTFQIQVLFFTHFRTLKSHKSLPILAYYIGFCSHIYFVPKLYWHAMLNATGR